MIVGLKIEFEDFEIGGRVKGEVYGFGYGFGGYVRSIGS